MTERAHEDGPASMRRLEASMTAFSEHIQALPAEVFLHRYTDWAPRDVVAHLIGWNRATQEAIGQIRRREMPPYIMDLPHDFANVNAASVQAYSSTDRAVLLDLLGRTGADLLAALNRLGPQDWMHDFGARNPIRQPVFIQRQVDGLSDDYEHHTHEMAQWLEQGSTE